MINIIDDENKKPKIYFLIVTIFRLLNPRFNINKM